MTFADFCLEALDHIQKGSYGFTPIPKLYTKGFRGETEKEKDFIRASNIKYFNSESEELLGNFIEMRFQEDKNKDIKSLVRLDMSYLYDEYCRGGWERVDKIIQANVDQSQSPEKDYLLRHIKDYSVIREHLIIRLLPIGLKNLDRTQHLFHQVGDIAVVLYILVRQDEKDTVSIRAPLYAAEEWIAHGETEEGLFQWALHNSSRIAPPRIYLNPLEAGHPPFELGIFMKNEESPDRIERLDPARPFPVILTAIKPVNGATAIFYPGVMERIAELFGCNYYVSFTSIHEAALHPAGQFELAALRRFLRQSNRTFPETVLSNSVYFYDRKRKLFYAR